MDRPAFEAAIRACSDAHQPAEARRLFDEMQSLGRRHPNLIPTTSTWNNLIYAYANRETADPAEVERLCDAMSRAGVARDKSTWKGVIKAYANVDDADGALRRLDDMRAAGFKPDLVAGTMVMGALASNKRMDEADRLFRRLLRDGVEPSLALWNQRIKAHALAADVTGVRTILRELERLGEGLRPDVVTFNHLITAHANVGDLPAVLRVFEQMQAPGSRTPPTLVTYKLVMAALTQAGEGHRAVGLFRQMVASGIEPDVAAYNVAINACAEVADNARAIGLLREMQAPASPVRPDASVYITTMKACANARDLAGTLALLAELRQPESRIEPDVFVYTTAIHACAMVRDASRATQLYEEMLAAGMRPDAAAYAALTNAHANAAEPADAVKISREREMQTQAAEVDVMRVVIKGFAFAQDPEGGERWFRDLCRRDANALGDLRTWSLLIDAYSKAERALDVRRLLEEAIEAGAVHPDAGFHAGQLDFHVAALAHPQAAPLNDRRCVPSSMALALMAHHRDKGRLTQATTYIVGHNRGDRVKTAVLDELHAQGLEYETDPGNPGRLVPATPRRDWWDETG